MWIQIPCRFNYYLSSPRDYTDSYMLESEKALDFLTNYNDIKITRTDYTTCPVKNTKKFKGDTK